jgi:hypothetical protein
MLFPGRFLVENTGKPYDGYHTMGTRKMPARPDLPVMPGGMAVYGRVMQEAIAERIQKVMGLS